MKVLITNDDGPPGSTSPFILPFVQKLVQDTDWSIDVCIPDGQRSWIGKAFHLADTVTATFYDQDKQSIYSARDPTSTSHWTLLSGTPATCVNIALHHQSPENASIPYDLVISGPNYGRNTSSVFMLGSGTIGAAMEAAVCGVPAVALSFAFFDRAIEDLVVDEACDVSVRIIKQLIKQWTKTVQLYNVNVPLQRGAASMPIKFTEILENKWAGCFVKDNTSAVQKWTWRPPFAIVEETVRQAGPDPLTDGWAVAHGMISITPLRASFATVPVHQSDLKL